MTTSVIHHFEGFKSELDTHYDRRERLIKASRDITALSKKIIFSLHRAAITPSSGEDAMSPEIASEVSKFESQIHNLMLSSLSELQGANGWRYQRNISGGIQEYVEAVTFRHYIQTQTVPSLSETQAILGQIELTFGDYILGVADLTGELARRAIAALAIPGEEALEYTKKILHCLRELTLQYQMLDAQKKSEGLKELDKKITVMESSLKKVEVGVFDKCVRKRECPEA